MYPKGIVTPLKIIKFVLIFCLFVSNTFSQPISAAESKQLCLLTISGDWTKIDSRSGTYVSKGHASAFVARQNATLSADWIDYDPIEKIIDAKGHVSIVRNGVITTGARFKFRASSDEYIVTDSRSVIGNVELSKSKLEVEPTIDESSWTKFESGKGSDK